MSNAMDVAKRFYAAGMPGSDIALADVVTDDITFDGPLAKASGLAEYEKNAAWFMEVVKDTTMHTMVAGDDEVVSIYDMHLELEGGVAMTLPISDWLTVKDGKVSAQRVYYDPRELAATLN